jgi:hypothetical protein
MMLISHNLGGHKKVTVVHFKVLARVRKLMNLSQELLPTQNSKPGTFITMLLLYQKLLKIVYTKHYG